MSERGEALQLLEQAEANIKSHEDSIRLAKELGLSVTITMTPECGISVLALARRGLDVFRGKLNPPAPRRWAMWEVGTLCFLAGYIFRVTVTW